MNHEKNTNNTHRFEASHGNHFTPQEITVASILNNGIKIFDSFYSKIKYTFNQI